MSQTLSRRGENDSGTYNKGDVYLAHRRLSIIDVDNGHQPMSFTYRRQKFTIVYNGEIYNTDLLRQKLAAAKIKLNTNCDTELVLKCYALDRENCLTYLRGIFAFAVYEEKSQTLFLARDQIGVKPLFYYYQGNQLAFGSEIKALLQHPAILPKVNLDGLRELFGIAPARTPGKTVFADIKEVKPGEYLVLADGKLTATTYFTLQSQKHTDDATTTATKIRQQLTTIVKQQLASDVNIGMFLSGGLDSSIITALSFHNLHEKVKTFSVDYTGNAENFVPTDFTPSRDNQFIDLIADKYQVAHQYKVINSPDLFRALHEAMVARDYPSMADIDSSMLLFCREVKKDITVCLSGEFADEIFCGYPWFYRPDALQADTFPWSINLEMRENTLAKRLRAAVNLQGYVRQTYRDAVAQAPLCPDDTKQDRVMKIFSYLTMRFFGLNLLERTDRTSMRSGLEVRVPFTDVDLVQYAYNIPWTMKNYGGYEKGILRQAFADELPSKVVYRKKSPYPKTVDPVYTKLVEDRIAALLRDEDNILWQIVDLDYVAKVFHDRAQKDTRPWFGQLMNRPQYLAFIIQIEMWLKEYHIVLDVDTNEPKEYLHFSKSLNPSLA